ncbi:MAG TPA: glycosyl hydrolase, partial [Thermomicrobiales bacterium]
HLSKDGGKSWENVTPPTELLPEWALISIIEPSPHDAATCYFAATRYKSDDLAPYLYKTDDWGQSWTRINTGIPDHHFTRVIRADPARQGVLYAGTEAGVWVSLDEGSSWSPLGVGLPVVPIHDLAVKDHDLVAATHGRGFWILDDLTPLHQLLDRDDSVDTLLFTPRETTRFLVPGRRPQVDLNQPRGYGSAGGLAVRTQIVKQPDGEKGLGFLDAGQNPEPGVPILYYLSAPPQESLTLRFLDAAGNEITSFTNTVEGGEEKADQKGASHGAPPEPKPKMSVGINRFVWNARYPDATVVPGAVFWAGGVTGPLASPGRYTVELVVDGQAQAASFDFVKDPRTTATAEDFAAQFALLLQIRDKLTATHEAINMIRALRQQADSWVERTKGTPQAEKVAAAAGPLREALTAVEDELIQGRSKSHEDPLNFPIKLNNKLAALSGVVGSADAAPTQGARQVFTDVVGRVDAQLESLEGVLVTQLGAFNATVLEAQLPAIVPPEKKW